MTRSFFAPGHSVTIVFVDINEHSRSTLLEIEFEPCLDRSLISKVNSTLYLNVYPKKFSKIGQKICNEKAIDSIDGANYITSSRFVSRY